MNPCWRLQCLNLRTQHTAELASSHTAMAAQDMPLRDHRPNRTLADTIAQIPTVSSTSSITNLGTDRA
jgi:hypothetical protein